MNSMSERNRNSELRRIMNCAGTPGEGDEVVGIKGLDGTGRDETNCKRSRGMVAQPLNLINGRCGMDMSFTTSTTLRPRVFERLSWVIFR